MASIPEIMIFITSRRRTRVVLWYGCKLQDDLGLSEDRVKSSCCAEEQRSLFYGDAMIKIMMMRRGLMTRLLKAAGGDPNSGAHTG